MYSTTKKNASRKALDYKTKTRHLDREMAGDDMPREVPALYAGTAVVPETRHRFAVAREAVFFPEVAIGTGFPTCIGIWSRPGGDPLVLIPTLYGRRDEITSTKKIGAPANGNAQNTPSDVLREGPGPGIQKDPSTSCRRFPLEMGAGLKVEILGSHYMRIVGNAVVCVLRDGVKWGYQSLDLEKQGRRGEDRLVTRGTVEITGLRRVTYLPGHPDRATVGVLSASINRQKKLSYLSTI
ncbi:hypothetical protein BU15DRAFT_59154 [Melanogaster broomeanus]|nr:hypothetical protein BU15DRAFT_59154 [Melanogaster broomeanus]